MVWLYSEETRFYFCVIESHSAPLPAPKPGHTWVGLVSRLQTRGNNGVTSYGGTIEFTESPTERLAKAVDYQLRELKVDLMFKGISPDNPKTEEMTVRLDEDEFPDTNRRME